MTRKRSCSTHLSTRLGAGADTILPPTNIIVSVQINASAVIIVVALSGTAFSAKETTKGKLAVTYTAP